MEEWLNERKTKAAWQVLELESDKELGHVLWQKSRERSHFLGLLLLAQFTHHINIYKNRPSSRLTLQ